MSGSHYIVAFKSLEASEKVGQQVEDILKKATGGDYTTIEGTPKVYHATTLSSDASGELEKIEGVTVRHSEG